jgi:CO/xanthine dehydrogenase Mo-binding subunit
MEKMFVSDVSVKGMLYAQTLRSPVAKGRLVDVQAPKLPSSYTLISAEDIAGKNQVEGLAVPIFAFDELSYIGEPVALLVGPDEAKLEEFASQCVVTAEEEKPDSRNPPPPEEGADPAQPCRKYTTGDFSAIVSGAETLLDGSYTTGIQEHWYSEAHGAVAVFREGNLTIHTATQWPYHVKRSAAVAVKIDEDSVVVEQTGLGIHLEGKLWYPSLIACQAAVAACVTGKPVKLMLTREEDFRFSPKRAAADIQICSIFDNKGTVLGTEIRPVINLGAGKAFAGELLDQTCLGCIGMYKLGTINLEGCAVTANIPPQGPMGGFGLSQGFFAAECHVSRIADSLRQDPAEWRKQNCLQKGGSLAIGVPLKDPVPIPQLIDTAAAMGDYYRKWASYELLRRSRNEAGWEIKSEPLRGIGIATAFQGAGLLYSGADKGGGGVELTLEKDGSLIIKTSILSSGEDSIRVWKDIAAELLSVESDNVRIANDGAAPDSGPSGFSRNVTVVTKLVEKCCQSIRKQRFRDPLPITVRRTVKPDKMIPWNGGEGEKPIDSAVFAHPGWGAAAVEIEIDPVSFQPHVRGVWLAVDGGKILSQVKARRSLKTAVIHALSWVSHEDIAYIDGKIPEACFRRYSLLSTMEAPPINIDFIFNDAAAPKGIGELPFSCIPAAYVQAVSQAMNHSFEKIPLGALDIWNAWQSKRIETKDGKKVEAEVLA